MKARPGPVLERERKSERVDEREKRVERKRERGGEGRGFVEYV